MLGDDYFEKNEVWEELQYIILFHIWSLSIHIPVKVWLVDLLFYVHTIPTPLTAIGTEEQDHFTFNM